MGPPGAPFKLGPGEKCLPPLWAAMQMVNYTTSVLKLGFCMARGICVTATSELKVHSIGQVLNLCLPCSNYNCKLC